MRLGLRYAARSHIGLVREGNEDALYAGPRLLAVADGMGGHAAGEVASAVVIAALIVLDDPASRWEDRPGAELLEALRDSALSANRQLQALVAGDPALEGMGTTLTAVLAAGDRLALLHIGDSRAYRLRGGELHQVTRDHTLVQALIDEGRITREEAAVHPQRSLVTRALDGRDVVELDLSIHEIQVGDRYLLCSDGLTGPVAALDVLADALRAGPPQEAVDLLVARARRGGGPDNVSFVVAAEVDLQGQADPAPILAGAAVEAAADPDRPALPPTGPAAPVTAPQPTAPRPVGRTHPLRLVALGVVLLTGLGLGTGWAYLRSQFYVGEDHGRVAVFRGVRGSFAGVALSRVDQPTTVDLRRLSTLAASQVDRGIVTDNRASAEQIVLRLRHQAEEPCLVVSAPPVAPSASPSPSPSPDLLASPAPSTTACPAVR